MDGLIPAMSEGSVAPGAVIPLDLASPIMPFREQSGLSIRVERLPFKARLSQGRNNGDNSWSLTVEELDGLRYLPPQGLTAAHTLTVRVIRIADDSASTLMKFDVPVSPGGPVVAAPPAAPAPPPDAGLAAEPPIPESVAAAPPPINRDMAPGAAILPAETAEGTNDHAGVAPDQAAAPETARLLEEEKASWEAEQHDRISAAVQDAVRRTEAETRTQLDHTNEERFAWEVERRVDEARAAWEAEQQGRVAAAVQDAVRKAEADARVQLDQTTEVRLSLELERRLGEARASWEAKQQGRIASAVQEAAQQAEAGAIARMEQANQARLAEVIDRRLSEARVSWEDEHQGQVAATVHHAVQKAETDIRAQLEHTSQAHHAQELERCLGEARAAWEGEMQGRVAAAVRDALEKSEMDARTRFERAQQEWRDASYRELAEMSARCNQAEAALDEARRQPPPRSENEAELRGLREEVATSQAVIRAREAEIDDLRQTLDRAMAAMPGRAIEAEANIERSRAAWHAEREQLIARSEETAQLRVRQALERWQHETQEALTKAKKEWADGESTRLAVAEAKWRESLGIAKSRAPIAHMTKKRHRTRLAGRVKHFLVVAACLAAAYAFYPRIEPIVVKQVWPTVGSYTGKVEKSFNKATKEIKAWLVKMEKRGEAIRKGKKEPRR